MNDLSEEIERVQKDLHTLEQDIEVLARRLEKAESRLEKAESRVDALEDPHAAGRSDQPAKVEAQIPPVVSAGESPAEAGSLFPVLGKALLGIAGAYVLRAIAETARCLAGSSPLPALRTHFFGWSGRRVRAWGRALPVLSTPPRRRSSSLPCFGSLPCALTFCPLLPPLR